MADNFTTQIDKFIVNTEEKMLAVVRNSIDLVVEEAQTSREKGGKMPVITGFLRSSGVAQIGSMPIGPIRGHRKEKYVPDAEQLGVVLNSLKMGDIFYFGWTAKYTRARELHHAFLDSAVQNWQAHVDESIKRFKK